MTDYAYTIGLTKIGKVLVEPFEPDVLYESIKGLGAALEDDERGEAVCPRLDFSAWATTETSSFIDSIDTPEGISVVVHEYDAQFPAKKHRRFAGVLVELPRRGKSADEDVFIFSATGFLTTYDEVDVTDPLSGDAYRDVYFTDLIDNLIAAAGHGELSVTPGPAIEADEPFTSTLFYPGKHRFGGAYNVTDRIKAICNDGTYIYIGAGHWLCRYNPATREAINLAALNYTGSLFDLANTDWRIVSIAYDAGNIEGWAESISADLKQDTAHVKISFTYAGGNTINLVDANLIYCHDRDYYVKSRGVTATNEGGPSGNDWATWHYKEIGESTPQSDKTLGLTRSATWWGGTLGIALVQRQRILRQVEPYNIKVGDNVILRSGTMWQDMGDILELEMGGSVEGWWDITVQYLSRYNFPVGTEVIVTPMEASKKSGLNLEIPGYREIKIEYEQVDGIGSATPVSTRVERRRRIEGRTTFYWPEVLGQADENSAVFVAGPYLALGEGNLPEQWKTAGPNTYYTSEAVPHFWLKMEDAVNFANLPVDGYWVQDGKQEVLVAIPFTGGSQVQPDRNTLMFNGAPVRIANESNDILQTRGKIYLAKEGNTVYAAWNRWRFKAGNWFLQVAWGKLEGATIKVAGRDRTWQNYQDRPPREITAFAVFNNKYWFGVKRIEPRWRNTAMQIVWAAPPQAGNKPTDFDGGMVASCMVSFDKTEYIRAGELIRVRAPGKSEAENKEYLISECEAISPFEITDTLHSYRTYGPEVRTRFIIFALDSFPAGKYNEQAKEELADHYVTIMEGWDIRGEICYGEANELKVGHTATEEFGEAFDGDLYDYEQEEWHGETVTPEAYGPHAVTDLSEERVIPGSVKVTMIDGKKEFVVTDRTSFVRGELPIPPLGEVYIKTREGGDYTETELYFNPAYLGGRQAVFSSEVEITLYLEGTPFDVQYEYYTNRFYTEPFVKDGALYFNETETGAIYRREDNTTWVRDAAWPLPVIAVDVLGDDVYALAENYMLMRYGKEWPGYINTEVGGADPISVFTALTKIAQAADCFLGEENGKILVRSRAQSELIVRNPDYENYEAVGYIEQKQYRGVLVTYANGKAYQGINDPPEDLIRKLTAPYIHDYGHALELAKRYFDYYDSGAVIYDVETARGTLETPLLAELIAVGEVKGRLLSYMLFGPNISMVIEKTVGKRLEVIS